MERYDPAHCCCFTGHRLEHMPPRDSDVYMQLRLELHKTVENAFANGYRVFFCGMCYGFDLLAAETIVSMKDAMSDSSMQLVGVLPYEGFGVGKRFPESILTEELLKRCDTVEIVSVSKDRKCYQLRNQFMVDHSSLVIVAHFGGKGGTLNTVNYAMRHGVPFINICEKIEWDGAAALEADCPRIVTTTPLYRDISQPEWVKSVK